MKKLALATALLLSPISAFAESDYLVTWQLTNGLSFDLIKLKADISEGKQFLTFNGGLYDADNNVAPAVGTCALLVEGRITCRFTAISRSYALELNSNLSGAITERGSDGSIIATSLATISSID